MWYTLPAEIGTRPITVIGGGTLGRRIALMLSLRGAEIRIFDTNLDVARAAVEFIEQERPAVAASFDGAPAGELTTSDDLAAALRGAWLVVEAVPEKLELKKKIFADLDRLAEPDAILASNSSSFATAEFMDGVNSPERVLNMHFYMPPAARSVELMSSTSTDPRIFDLLTAELPRYALVPHLVREQSTGFIFNRIWAAIKRESLAVVAEGVAEPEDIDALFADLFKADAAPFRFMDQVGLDVVLDIENHYSELEGRPNKVAPLLQEYIDKGWLGVKSGRGFYNDYA
ncbi:3-hydroxyacyl-CoA dehydrogenase family protein [Paenarthrobacter sp. DKR-5]|uniref:3-hydroxyacyl-CoA dehydrogenase family protein n=1 Tax=Paenarthrobacter sp. DKR-5 TaxID=2835535 RepID=UPI001BDC4469|nr:3-hydroxyacyl-CoA dehydrogenase family protein [Paenarthrobacter sp. DKR-5]MBT1004243.1 3-hydroxyacyl-CoA dehydrogenase family protein [Paenarthrobacter sp. DKR-5]